METSPTHFQRVQHLIIDDQQHDRRVDNFLIGLLSLPKSRVYRMIRKGEVRVNKKRVKADYRIQMGDTLRIPPVFIENEDDLTIPDHISQMLLETILYEDERFVIINKPSGMPVHAGSGLPFGVIEVFKAHPTFKNDFIELAHRIDRDTSGCLLLVKQPRALREVHSLLREPSTEKRYLALLKGKWEGGMRIIDFPLKKNQVRGGERFVAVDPEGKSAKSEFRPVFSTDDCTLVEVILHTGRTHQIRVHAAAINMPIAGDQKYGDDAFNRQLRQIGMRRLFLHARQFSFSPSASARISACAPLDASLLKTLDQLGIPKP